MRYAIFALLVAGPANAYCIQDTGYNFATSVEGAVKWLTCLHNEQALKISQLDTRLATHEVDVARLQSEVQDIKKGLEGLRSSKAANADFLDVLKLDLRVQEIEKTLNKMSNAQLQR